EIAPRRTVETVLRAGCRARRPPRARSPVLSQSRYLAGVLKIRATPVKLRGGGPLRMVRRQTWSGRERSSHSRAEAVPKSGSPPLPIHRFRRPVVVCRRSLPSLCAACSVVCRIPFICPTLPCEGVRFPVAIECGYTFLFPFDCHLPTNSHDVFGT